MESHEPRKARQVIGNHRRIDPGRYRLIGNLVGAIESKASTCLFLAVPNDGVPLFWGTRLKNSEMTDRDKRAVTACVPLGYLVPALFLFNNASALKS